MNWEIYLDFALFFTNLANRNNAARRDHDQHYGD